jgi:hypothetical protein
MYRYLGPTGSPGEGVSMYTETGEEVMIRSYTIPSSESRLPVKGDSIDINPAAIEGATALTAIRREYPRFQTRFIVVNVEIVP